MLQSLGLIESSADMDVELNVELTSAPTSTTGNIAYMVQLVALHTRYDFHVLFHVEPSSVSVELIKNPLFSVLQIPVLIPSYRIFKERGCRCSVLPIRQEVHLYFPKIRVQLA